MIGNVRKIAINPQKRDKDNLITKDEYAHVTIEVSLDSHEQKQAIMKLFELLNNEDVHVDFEPIGRHGSQEVMTSLVTPVDEAEEEVAD